MVKKRTFTTNRFTVYYENSFAEVLEDFNLIIAVDSHFENLPWNYRFSEAIRRLINHTVKQHFDLSGAETEEEKKKLKEKYRKAIGIEQKYKEKD